MALTVAMLEDERSEAMQAWASHGRAFPWNLQFEPAYPLAHSFSERELSTLGGELHSTS